MRRQRMTSKERQLSRSLAVVSVAGLAAWTGLPGGAIAVLAAVGGEALKEAVSRTSGFLENDAAAWSLTLDLERAIQAWAASDGVTRDRTEIAAGLELATAALSGATVSIDTLASFDFSADRAANQVWASACLQNPEWELSSEPRFVIAKGAIRAVYAGIVHRVLANEPALLPAMERLRGQFQAQVREVESTFDHRWTELGATIDQLTTSISDIEAKSADPMGGQPSHADLQAYLRARLADWNSVPWLPAVQLTAIEQEIKLVPQNLDPGPAWDCDRVLEAYSQCGSVEL